MLLQHSGHNYKFIKEWFFLWLDSNVTDKSRRTNRMPPFILATKTEIGSSKKSNWSCHGLRLWNSTCFVGVRLCLDLLRFQCAAGERVMLEQNSEGITWGTLSPVWSLCRERCRRSLNTLKSLLTYKLLGKILCNQMYLISSISRNFGCLKF